MVSVNPTPPGPRRTRRSSGLLAIVAVIGFVLVWWLFSGNGPRGPDGNDPRLSVPDVDASGDPDDPDSGPSVVPVAVPGGVRIVSYETTGAGLELRARLEAGDCAVLDTPTVLESDVAVTVTLTQGGDRCRPLARPREVLAPVRLDAPLGERSVLDGALEQRVRVEPGT